MAGIGLLTERMQPMLQRVGARLIAATPEHWLQAERTISVSERGGGVTSGVAHDLLAHSPVGALPSHGRPDVCNSRLAAAVRGRWSALADAHLQDRASRARLAFLVRLRCRGRVECWSADGDALNKHSLGWSAWPARSRQSDVAIAKKTRSSPAPAPGGRTPKHLAASMRVARAEIGPAQTTIASTRDLILRIAAETRKGAAGPANLALVGRFERVTGVSIEELERLAGRVGRSVCNNYRAPKGIDLARSWRVAVDVGRSWASEIFPGGEAPVIRRSADGGVKRSSRASVSCQVGLPRTSGASTRP
jgi:hypothetical protein